MRRMRWLPALLVVVWLGLGALGGPYAGKLADVAENDHAAFLPDSAEATEVADLQRRFSDQDLIPAVVVAERDGGITTEDVDYLGGRAAALTRIEGVAEPPQQARPSEDGEALQLVVSI